MTLRFYKSIVLTFLALSIPCMASEPEVRGTWLTTSKNDEISSPAKTAATMRQLRDIGINTVYIECWKQGYTEFPSETMQKLIGVAMKVNNAPPALQRDLLQEAVIQAHRNGMLAIAWFEYGFMAASKTTHNPLRALGEKEGWLLRDQTGSIISKRDNFVWMNPLHPKAQQILLGVVLDAARNYDLDGVQLDDRISMPTEMGYDDYTRALYAKEHNGKQPPADTKNPEWIKWRADKITEFARRFAKAVHQVNGNLIVSVSPAPYPWSYVFSACDWPTWMKWTGDERWDECVPQNYRVDFNKTRLSIEQGLRVIGNRRRDLLTGILVKGDARMMPANDLLNTIRFERAAGMAGHVIWYSPAVVKAYPEELKKLYNVAQSGQASHPGRPANWRTPVIATKSGDGAWHFTIAQAGKYQVISNEHGGWIPLDVQTLSSGEGKIERPGSIGVELLPDRRP